MLPIMLRKALEDLIRNYEPRVNTTQIDVNVSDDNNSVYITIWFTILNTITPVKLDLVLERTR